MLLCISLFLSVSLYVALCLSVSLCISLCLLLLLLASLTALSRLNAGLGTRMMLKAEELARQHGKARVAVISGIGARGFYSKIGYETRGRGGFMIKDVQKTAAERIFLVPLLNLVVLAVAIWSFV